MNKIQALKKTVYNLENDVYVYDWSMYNSCNCGILAQTLLGGKTPEEAGFLKSPARGEYGCFAKEAFCINTNLPIPKVFKVLKDTGFTHKELHELEYLSNPIISKKAGLDIINKEDVWESYCILYSEKDAVIKYIKAWVEIMKEEQVEKASQPERTRIVYVTVSETIKE